MRRRIKALLWAMIVILPTTVAVPAAQAAGTASQVPGTFAVTVKGQLPGSTPQERRQFARLAVYSFREPSTDPSFMNFRMDAWSWDTTATNSDTIGNCQTGSLIGHNLDGTEPSAADANKSVQCAAKGLQEPALTRMGTYCGPNASDRDAINPGDTFTIYWHDNAGNTTPGCSGSQWERWRYSSRTLDGGKLAMIEMLGASNVDTSSSFYAASSPYNPNALNVGWGFGGRGVGPKGGATINEIADGILNDDVVYHGYWKPWNNWCSDAGTRNESVRGVSINPGQWKKTNGTYAGSSSPKLRIHDTTRTATQLYDVFSYLSVPDKQQSSFTDRRINMDVGNDFNDNGHIADDFGHTQSGLQVIDSSGSMVGFVSVEVGHNGGTTNGGYDTLSSLYYLRSDITPTDPVGTVRC
ncbi:hypothetical protein [Planotetraspora mira]|uniref:Uncharacterized protein n=1 Tax=Planotetraspora mira TaxID=58121 RepID=A0A8J3X6S4_9ACTN|nr:hypothetical protein [Planotetraspora mira]GII30127.1 hypothetical protein Pmi06nite_35690 [Planotetraspora mira]